MQQRLRIHYTESQKALMWDRWKQGDSLQQIALTTGKAIGAAFSRCLDGAVGTVDAGGKEKGKGGVLKVHICALSIAAWSMPLASCAARSMVTALLLQGTAARGD